VDEVLAVGDAEFQKKCLGKMKDVAGHGRTVLFVSHNMWAIRKLCTKGIFIQDGSISVIGEVNDVVESYIGKDGKGLSVVKVSRSILIDRFDVKLDYTKTYDAVLELEFITRFERECVLDGFCVVFNSENGTRVAILDTRNDLDLPMVVSAGNYKSNIIVDNINFIEGRYGIDIFIESNEYTGEIKDICYFDILNKKVSTKEYAREHQGVCKLKFKTAFIAVDSTLNIS